MKTHAYRAFVLLVAVAAALPALGRELTDTEELTCKGLDKIRKGLGDDFCGRPTYTTHWFKPDTMEWVCGPMRMIYLYEKDIRGNDVCRAHIQPASAPSYCADLARNPIYDQRSAAMLPPPEECRGTVQGQIVGEP